MVGSRLRQLRQLRRFLGFSLYARAYMDTMGKTDATDAAQSEAAGHWVRLGCVGCL